MSRRARLLVPLVVLALVAGTAFTALNTVTASRAGETINAVTIAQLAPTECAALTLTQVAVASGVFRDSNGASLILGSAGADTITARNRGDCIVGGAGDDVIDGGGGRGDVCIGGPGTDVFRRCETSYQ